MTKIEPKLAQVAPRGAQMEPKWNPGVPKWSPKHFQNARKHIQSQFKVPLGHQNLPQSVFEVKAASSGFELQAKASRGRVLAEGDLDPAAGSRDEPTRLHVETPIEAQR